MRGWARNTYPRVDVDHETRKFVSHHRAEENRKRNWYEAWKRWMADGNAYLIKHGAKSTNVVDFPSGQQLTGTDATVAGWGAVADSFDTEDSA